MDDMQRAGGILLHPTSLPGRFGVGDLGPEARRFVDKLALAGQSLWQVLPLHPAGQGGSPYSGTSAFAGNTLLISPEMLAEDGLVSKESVDAVPEFASGTVDLQGAAAFKKTLLDEAFERFDGELRVQYAGFCRENGWWLEDYALFSVLKSENGGRAWNEWPVELRRREPSALTTAIAERRGAIDRERFAQFLFNRQWSALREYSAERGVRIIGDIPIFVAYDSADVWCNQRMFRLRDDGSPEVVAGVPPDFFSETGQLWGNPMYRWDRMAEDGFGWWTARLAAEMRLADIVRLDHFIGFVRNWEVPAGDATAENGEWKDVPGRELFAALKRRLGRLAVIAEDLGAMTAEVEELRDANGFPGMRILHNAFGGDALNRDLPHNYIRNAVAYTGTHDNDTTAGWYRNAPKNVRDHVRRYLKCSGRDVHWDMIRAALASVADMAIIPAQDILGVGSEARMNTPATADGNWLWRLADGQPDEGSLGRLRELTELYGRVRR